MTVEVSPEPYAPPIRSLGLSLAPLTPPQVLEAVDALIRARTSLVLHHGEPELCDALQPPRGSARGESPRGVHPGRRHAPGLDGAMARDTAARAGGRLGPDLRPVAAGGGSGLSRLPARGPAGRGRAGVRRISWPASPRSRSSGSNRPTSATCHRSEHAALLGPGPRRSSGHPLRRARSAQRASGGSISHHRDLGVPVSVQVGASLDFAAGRVSRAPRILQRTGLEWVYRLALEPRRLTRRYLENGFFFLGRILRGDREARSDASRR